jgi:chromatin assembly factor 1 subunit B
VNVVRWSQNGEILASSGDDGMIILWRISTDNTNNNNFEEENGDETWIAFSILRCPSDVYDLNWSPCGTWICSGSIDNISRIWNVKTQKCVHILKDHSHFVQGVAWDPLGYLLATQSSDRSVVIYNLNSSAKFPDLKVSVHTKLYKNVVVSESAVDPASDLMEPTNRNNSTSFPAGGRLFHDESLMSFFRRLSFSPDGSILVTPSAIYTSDALNSSSSSNNVLFVFTRNQLKIPSVVLPGHSRPSIVVKFSPILYCLKDESDTDSLKGENVFDLKYRMIFAVGTQDSVIIYDTQHQYPLFIFCNLHLATITDVAWTKDGNHVLVSSTDGFCSSITFEDNELGIIYRGQEQFIPKNELFDSDKENVINVIESDKSSNEETAEKSPTMLKMINRNEEEMNHHTSSSLPKKRRICPIFLGARDESK